jgi:hypothetical protein
MPSQFRRTLRDWADGRADLTEALTGATLGKGPLLSHGFREPRVRVDQAPFDLVAASKCFLVACRSENSQACAGTFCYYAADPQPQSPQSGPAFPGCRPPREDEQETTS